MTYSIIAGDLEPDMPLQVFVNNVAESLTGALAVQLRWKKPDGTVSIVSLTTVVLATGSVKRVWVAGDTDQAGTHYGQIRVTRSNGEYQTFPSDNSWHSWEVHPVLV